MNQKPVGDTIFIPKKMKEKHVSMSSPDAPENKIFDKAEDAQTLDELKLKSVEVSDKLAALAKDLKASENKEEIQSKIDRWTSVQEKLTEKIDLKSKEISSKA